MESKEFSSRLKAIRAFSGRSVPEISSHLISLGYKASEKTIYSWEAGRSQPTPDAFLDFCRYCGVVDVMTAFGYKKSPGTDESAPRNELEREVIRLAGNLSDEQKDFFLALLRLTAARNQGLSAADLVSAGEAALKAESHNPSQ